ncbi:MAG: hypothetical protein RMY62_000090, partial [Nostoc sp. ZfuVER08]|nr:hypothetical protein [Nostoc sp. ZfuVER08]
QEVWEGWEVWEDEEEIFPPTLPTLPTLPYPLISPSPHLPISHLRKAKATSPVLPMSSKNSRVAHLAVLPCCGLFKYRSL